MTRNSTAAQDSVTTEPFSQHPEAEGLTANTSPTTHDSITCRATPREPAFRGNPSVNTATSSSPSLITEQRLPEDLLTKNRLTIVRLEHTNALAPGILTITPAGELVLTEDSLPEPDNGTMNAYYWSQGPSSGTPSQIPTWLREYLIKEINVLGHGPPAICRAFYDHLLAGREDYAQNHTVLTAETSLAFAVISLRYAIDEVQSFVGAAYVSEETYEEEVQVVIRNVKRMVGYQGEEISMELRLLLELASLGPAMKQALIEPLESLIIGPFTRLVGKLELVSKALRIELDHLESEADRGRRENVHTPDSGVSGCSS